MNKLVKIATMTAGLALVAFGASAQGYSTPTPLMDGVQAQIVAVEPKNDTYRIAYMPPATSHNYYIALGEGLKTAAAEAGVDVFMLAPQSGDDINGQMGMLQDVLSQEVDAIIFSTHDEFAAAPLIKQAVNQGVAVLMVNTDIPNFPTPIHGVLGYSQRGGTHAMADWIIESRDNKPSVVGILEGQPGYHSKERVAGFLEGIEGNDNFEVVVSIDGQWSVEGGNKVGMDMLQAHPNLDVIFAANDNMAIGASYAAKALGKSDIIITGLDGDTFGLEEVAAGNVSAIVATAPYVMGTTAMSVILDILNGTYPGGFVETPTSIADKAGAVAILQVPEILFPQPSKEY